VTLGLDVQGMSFGIILLTASGTNSLLCWLSEVPGKEVLENLMVAGLTVTVTKVTGCLSKQADRGLGMTAKTTITALVDCSKKR